MRTTQNLQSLITKLNNNLPANIDSDFHMSSFKPVPQAWGKLKAILANFEAAGIEEVSQKDRAKILRIILKNFTL